MRDDQTCAIVRDLLPSLSEGLTSEKTTMWIMEHLDACPECKEKYDILNEVDPAILDTPSRQEMDRDVKYMKKVKKKFYFIIPAAVICACAILLTSYYFLFVKKFYVPTSAMTVSLEQDFPDTTCHCDITLPGRYSVAEKEADEILYIKDSESANHVDYTIRYSYSLWDYLFPSKETRTEQLLISNDFVANEYPGMSILNTPARLILKGNSEEDSKILWNSMELLPTAKAIFSRFMNAVDAHDPAKTKGLTAFYEMTQLMLGTIESGSGFVMSLQFDDESGSEELVLHDIFIMLRNMNLSDNDLRVLKDSAVLLTSTTQTTASEISNGDSSAPDEKVQISKVGLYIMPDVKMEAASDIKTLYIGIGYHFGMENGEWIFEKTADGTVNGEGDSSVITDEDGTVIADGSNRITYEIFIGK